MNQRTISLAVAAALVLLGAEVVYARGFGGAHAGGGASAGGYRGGGSFGGESRGNYSSGGQRGGSYSGAEGAAAGHAATENRAPQYSGAEGAAAGHAATENREPQYSGAQGAAAGAAAANRNAPQFSGAEGAAAGYAAGNRNTFPASAAHVALPTDAGYGVPATRAGTAAYAGYHQTEAVNSNIYAARGAAVRSAYNTPGLYGQDWHAANLGAWFPAGWRAGQAWDAATWPMVGVSLGWGDLQPAAYDYGTNITYQDNEVYYGNQPAATAEQYYQQAATLAESAPAPAPTGDWLPLGVFALVRKEQSDPQFVMHLAVNKAGVIAGNYSDLVSGTTVPIQGAVDKRTQRAAWTVGKNKTTVCETGLYNLTQDEAPALIHMGKDKTQQWLLVRLKQPE